MCRLFETIKIINGKPEHIGFHNTRLNNSRKELLGLTDVIDLREIITVPARHGAGIHKCKVVYSSQIHEIMFETYPGRSIRSLKAVHCNDIEYQYKYIDRNRINELFGLRECCDDILIVKNDRVTDTSISNIVFHDGTRWVTPRTPLLKGTKREQLLAEGAIIEADIGTSDIPCFKKACLINTMLELNEKPVEIGNIIL